MRISGSHTVDVPRQAFWDAMQDPAVLARTLPGCESLTTIGEDAYAATLTAGVASIKGTYSGQVQLSDKQPPESCRLVAEGAGTPGTIRADAVVRLEADGEDRTTVHYDADAVVGGMIGGVGQRMLAAAARRTTGEFFDALAAEVTGGPQPAAAPSAAGAPAAATAGAPSGDGQAPATGGEVGTVHLGRAATGGGGQDAARRAELFGAFALGALVALVGVLVGRRSARPSSVSTPTRRTSGRS